MHDTLKIHNSGALDTLSDYVNNEMAYDRLTEAAQTDRTDTADIQCRSAGTHSTAQNSAAFTQLCLSTNPFRHTEATLSSHFSPTVANLPRSPL